MKKRVLTGIFTIMVFALAAAEVSAQVAVKKQEPSNTYVYLILAALLFTLAVLFASIMIFESGERKTRQAAGLLPTEKELLMTDHNYDGIMELDNPPPAWFQFLFYFTIAFAFIYMINYHVLSKQNSSVDEYMQEMAIANAQREELVKTGALINENNVVALTDQADLDKGKEIYTANCVSCHNVDGGGGVGPNFTDDNWIHGGGIVNVFKTVKYGVPAKGMITWQTQLNPKQIQQVSSYVLTFRGKTPSAPKAPEGPVWVDTTAAPKDTLKTK
ncbi:MAG: c-type cytochrome [Ignavibacteria bacterium]|jgi:cytochrome c oxidase cbb3-type subunit 3|nr:c-type cytochrome [Ignavibacteria bacterium]